MLYPQPRGHWTVQGRWSLPLLWGCVAASMLPRPRCLCGLTILPLLGDPPDQAVSRGGACQGSSPCTNMWNLNDHSHAPAIKMEDAVRKILEHAPRTAMLLRLVASAACAMHPGLPCGVLWHARILVYPSVINTQVWVHSGRSLFQAPLTYLDTTRNEVGAINFQETVYWWKLDSCGLQARILLVVYCKAGGEYVNCIQKQALSKCRHSPAPLASKLSSTAHNLQSFSFHPLPCTFDSWDFLYQQYDRNKHR